jgi:hypothetical protein
MLTKARQLKAEKPDLPLDVNEDLLELIFIEIASGFVRKKHTVGKLQQVVRKIKEKTSS